MNKTARSSISNGIFSFVFFLIRIGILVSIKTRVDTKRTIQFSLKIARRIAKAREATIMNAIVV